jgi:hypothetical protein
MRALRQLIRYILIESHHEDDRGKHDRVDPDKEEQDDDLLLEPDEAGEGDDGVEEMNSMGGAGGIGGAVRGVTTPLGTGPTYPDEPVTKKKKKKGKKQPRSRPVVVSKAFGGGDFPS